MTRPLNPPARPHDAPPGDGSTLVARRERTRRNVRRATAVIGMGATVGTGALAVQLAGSTTSAGSPIPSGVGVHPQGVATVEPPASLSSTKTAPTAAPSSGTAATQADTTADTPTAAGPAPAASRRKAVGRATPASNTVTTAPALAQAAATAPAAAVATQAAPPPPQVYAPPQQTGISGSVSSSGGTGTGHP